jgi:aflatoxin B1 aldehyde reductase
MSAKPRLILGLFTFSPNEYQRGRIGNLNDFKTAMDIFQSRGYNELDTARSYGGGSQENFTREAGWKEKGFQVATKIYPFEPISHKRDCIIEQFNLSLSSLGADSIDVSYCCISSEMSLLTMICPDFLSSCACLYHPILIVNDVSNIN